MTTEIRHNRTSKVRAHYIKRQSITNDCCHHGNETCNNPMCLSHRTPTQKCELLIKQLNQSISKLQGQVDKLEKRLAELLSGVSKRLSVMATAQERELANERLLLMTLEQEIDLSVAQIHKLKLKEQNLLYSFDDLERQNELVNEEIQKQSYQVFKKGQMASFVELEEHRSSSIEKEGQKDPDPNLWKRLHECEKDLEHWQEFRPPPDVPTNELNPFIMSHIQDAFFQLVMTSDDSKKEHIYENAILQMKSLYKIHPDEIVSEL